MSRNPTKSVLVNEVINKVKKMEVHKQGKSLQARRALTIEEFKFLMFMLNELMVHDLFPFTLQGRMSGQRVFLRNDTVQARLSWVPMIQTFAYC